MVARVSWRNNADETREWERSGVTVNGVEIVVSGVFGDMERLLLATVTIACCTQIVVSNFDLYMNETETLRLLGK